jgi:hypothetical protein
MKKIIIALLILTFSACKSKTAETKTDNSKTAEEVSKSRTADDEMSKWIVGKEWKADRSGAPITTMKMYSDDSCDYVYGKCDWRYTDGNFIFGNLVSYPFKKLTDTSFSLYVEVSKETYGYNLVRKL